MAGRAARARRALAFADASIVVLGLPDIYRELETTVVEASWVITVYAIVVVIVSAVLALLASRVRAGLLDPRRPAGVRRRLRGQRRGTSIGVLYAGRTLQGAGAAWRWSVRCPSSRASRAAAHGGAPGGSPPPPSAPRSGLRWAACSRRRSRGAIFIVQVPVALLALLALAGQDGCDPRRRRPASGDRRATSRAGRGWPTSASCSPSAHSSARCSSASCCSWSWDTSPLPARWSSAPSAASFAVRPLGHRLAPAVAGATARSCWPLVWRAGAVAA